METSIGPVPRTWTLTRLNSPSFCRALPGLVSTTTSRGGGGAGRDVSLCCSTLRKWKQNAERGGGAPRLCGDFAEMAISVKRPVDISWRLSDSAPSAAASPTLSSEDQQLAEYIASGVLPKIAGISAAKVLGDLQEWRSFGDDLSDHLEFHKDNLSVSEKSRIYQYYLPVFFWCLDQLSAHRSCFAPGEPVPPLVIGINAPQGCGKTTVVDSLEFLFNSTGRSCAAISVDDFYLTGAEHDKNAANNPGNRLLEFRGNAGSHDLKFGTDTIEALLGLGQKGAKANVPRYDKAARNGRGDRGDASMWPVVEGPLEVLLFEGWMLGFEPEDPQRVVTIDPGLAAVNESLKSYYDAWHRYIDCWIVIEVDDLSWVFEWRLEAEVQMKKKGRGGMTDEQVAEFVSTYMPAYKAYLPSLYSNGPRSSVQSKVLKFGINKSRNPIE